MPRRKGKKYIYAMKDHLYRKVLYRPTFPAFNAMLNAGTSATLPTALQNIVVPPGYNTDYGILYAQLVTALLQGINNYLMQVLSSVNLATANAIAIALGQFPFNPPVSNGQQYLIDLGTSYDGYVNECSVLIQPAVFDETLFGLSAFQPAFGYSMEDSYCKSIEQKFHEFFTKIQQNNIAYDITTLGVGKTNVPTVEKMMFDAIQGTGVSEALTRTHTNFYDLPDLAQFALSYLSVLNKTLSSGIALDASWFDRSAFTANEGDYQQLANGFLLQNLAQWFGVVTDFTPLDFAILMPSFPEKEETLDDLIATLSAEKAIISVFAQLFGQHLYDPSLGGTEISQSLRTGYYASAFDVYLHINEIVKRKYSNVMYAQMMVDAITEIARYPYRGNLSYDAGQRSLSYSEFLKYWRNKWTFYGLKPQDLDYAQKLGERFQAGAHRQSEQKLQRIDYYAKTYKPLFYRKGYRGVGSEVS